MGATPITWSEDPHFDLQLHLGAHFLKPPAEQQDDNGEDLESFEIVVMNPDDEEDWKSHSFQIEFPLIDVHRILLVGLRLLKVNSVCPGFSSGA